MMYQRDMGSLGLAEQADEELDDRAERAVHQEEEERQQRGHDEHHDGGDPGFLAGRPYDLARFGADLADEFTGRCLGHVGLPSSR